MTYGKSYEVVNTRNYLTDDICIRGDDGLSWWFEQIKDPNSSNLGDIIYAGGWQCWTMWFITEKEWSRDQNSLWGSFQRFQLDHIPQMRQACLRWSTARGTSETVSRHSGES